MGALGFKMIFQDEPSDFHPKFEVVSCFIETKGEILLLHRQDHKPEGNTWGVPAGKVDPNETISEAMTREIREETGIKISFSIMKYFGKLYVRYPNCDFVYHTFGVQINKPQKVILNIKEHKDFKWLSPKDALNLPFVKDMDSCIKLFYNIKMT